MNNSMSGSSNKKAELSDWLAYHKSLINDIQFAKNQQWRLSYYTVLLLAAVFGLSKSDFTKPEYINFFILTAFLLGIFSTYFLIKFQKDLERYRQNIGRVRENFPGDLQQIAAFKKAEGSPTYYVSFLYFMIGVIWAIVCFIGWSIEFGTDTPITRKIIDTKWHDYEGRKIKVIGDNRDLVQVISDGWKIIDKISNENEYEWGWEVNIKALEHPNPFEKETILKDGRIIIWMCSIEKIEYTLLDKDGFELAKDVINSKDLHWGSTEKFRSTNAISENKAIRAANSACRITLVSKPWS